MDSLDKRALGRNIRQARCRLGLTQGQMAELIDMAPEVYGRMERGNLVPRLERFVAICRVLGETPERLVALADLHGEDEPLPSRAEGPGIEALKRKLGANMRESRKKMGLTQAEMAVRVQMSLDTYGRMERGTLLPRLDTFVTICQVLGEMSDDLLGLPRGRKSKSR